MPNVTNNLDGKKFDLNPSAGTLVHNLGGKNLSHYPPAVTNPGGK